MGDAGNDPVKQGQLLRKALIEQIRFAKKTDQFRCRGKHYWLDIDETVKQYVPEGCTFDYAENVLRSAGFTLSPRQCPSSPPGIYAGGEYEFDVIAGLGYGPELFFEGVQCLVHLRPATPYDYNLVHSVLTDCGATVLGDFRQPHIGQIEDVSDTAFLVAAYRAIETRRTDALFYDPLAAKLAGAHGEKIIRNRPKWSPIGQWLVAIRTRIIDDFIENAIAEGTATILNLGAGLDTRPYRMNLPGHIRWIEIDYPKIIDLKERRLSGEKPCCNLERMKLDLADVAARKRLFAQIAERSGKTLILTEGVIPYLHIEDVASLADDLRDHAVFQHWIADYSSPETRRFRQRVARRIRMQNAPFLFKTDNYFGFFREHGWQPESIRYISEEAQKLNRSVSLPLLWRWQIGWMSTKGRSRRALLRSTGCVLLQQ